MGPVTRVCIPSHALIFSEPLRYGCGMAQPVTTRWLTAVYGRHTSKYSMRTRGGQSILNGHSGHIFTLTLSLQPLLDTLKDTLSFPPPSTPSPCPFHRSECEMGGLLHILAFLCCYKLCTHFTISVTAPASSPIPRRRHAPISSPSAPGSGSLTFFG